MQARAKLHRLIAIGALCGAALLAQPTAGAAQSGPFAGLAGTWSGGGTIVMNTGSNERIRCRVTYAVASGGASVRQDLRCASDSYRFDLVADVVNRGGTITGTWSESNRGAGGSLRGRMTGGKIEALVESSAFSAVLSVNTQGDRQSVSIRPRGIEVTEVSMTLRKGSR